MACCSTENARLPEIWLISVCSAISIFQVICLIAFRLIIMTAIGKHSLKFIWKIIMSILFIPVSEILSVLKILPGNLEIGTTCRQSVLTRPVCNVQVHLFMRSGRNRFLRNMKILYRRMAPYGCSIFPILCLNGIRIRWLSAP